MTTKLYASGSTEVPIRDPDADGFRVVLQQMGTVLRALDGSARQHLLATKRAWQLRWTGLTAAQYSSILAQAQAGPVLSFVAPDGATVYTVLVTGAVQASGDGYSYAVEFTLEEV